MKETDYETPTKEEIQKVLIHLCKSGLSEETVLRVCYDNGINPDDYPVEGSEDDSVGILPWWEKPSEGEEQSSEEKKEEHKPFFFFKDNE